MADRCKSCGAQIIWCKTTNGKAMPVDAAPVLAGNIVLERLGLGGMVLPEPVAHVVSTPRQGEARYVSHFSSCPKASEHRKGKR